MNDLQRIQVKVLSNAPRDLRLEPFIEIFGRWRMEKQHPAVWVDVADYAHMPRGPGIVLCGQRCNFSFDMGDPAPGPLYFARRGLTGSVSERLHSAVRSCFELTQRLLGEPEFPASVRLELGSVEMVFPDRLETPNAPEVDRQLRPLVRQLLDTLYGTDAYQLSPYADARQPLGYSIRARAPQSLEALLSRMLAVSR